MAGTEGDNELERFKSDVTSDDSILEPHLKYLLDNMLTENDVTRFETQDAPAKNHRDHHTELSEYVEKTKRDKFLERYSSFSLVPDAEEQTAMSAMERNEAFEKILCEERLRRSSAQSIRSLSSVAYTRMQEPSEEMQRFLKVKRRLEQVKKYCPTLYGSEEDIIQMWGRMKD